MSRFYELTAIDINGKTVHLSKYKGQVCLVVNLASYCGYTPQYTGLQKLYDAKKGAGLAILGFPCNQFAKEEPGTDEEIKLFCKSKYGVGFDLFSKIDVKGKDQCPVYDLLTGSDNPLGPHKVRWNFQKYLIDRKGRIAGTYDPDIEPSDPKLTSDIETALAVS